MGEYDGTYIALLRQRVADDNITGEHDLDRQFKAHMNRGVLLLAARVKSLPDLLVELARPRTE